jgi:hypothetical protein
MRTRCLVSVFALSISASGGAQSLSQQLRGANGTVQMLYPTRPNVCGDGQGSILNVMGRAELSFYSGSLSYGTSRRERRCEHGPARLVLTVFDGEVTRARVYVGPTPAPAADVRTISASANDAAAWLTDVVAHGNARAASDLLLPLILVEGSEPWRFFLQLVRDENRPRDLKRSVMMWLSNAVSDHLGILDETARSDEDEMRDQAVYVLSQRPRSEGVPALIEVAKSSTHPSARRSAIYWLGQSGDPRAIEVYADLLGLR